MSTLCLIDLSSIWWQSWHASEGQEVGAAYSKTLDKVHRFASGHDYVAICCDSPPYKRSEIYPEYKANREKHTAVALEQYRRVREELERRYPVLIAEGYEADDVIATAVGSVTDDTVIVSGDKDLMQLVDARDSDECSVSLISTQTGRTYDEGAVYEKFGVYPRDMDQFLALVGDSADNIPGVPRVGGKTAAKLLADHGTLTGILDAAKRGDIPGVVGKNLVEHEAQLGKSYQLVQLLTDAPIDMANIFEEKPVTEPEPEPEPEPEVVETVGEVVDDRLPEPEQPVTTPPQTTAIVQAPNWSLQLEPTNSGGAIKLAELMYESRMFGKWPNKEAVLSIILRGRELGLGAATALANFHLVDGKPVMAAYLIIGLVLKSPLCEYFEFTESTATKATWIAKRRGSKHEQTLTYTIEDACDAELVKRDTKGRDGFSANGQFRINWDRHRPDFLRKTCGVKLARAVWPDITAGLYCEEEL